MKQRERNGGNEPLSFRLLSYILILAKRSMLCLIKNVTAIESVQRRFTKRLYTWSQHIMLSGSIKPPINKLIPSLQLRRLHTDLIWCYKIVFGMADLKFEEFFEWRPRCGTIGHAYKYKKNQQVHVSKVGIL